MKDIDLEQLGTLLDGELENNESARFNADVRVIGESATDLLFSYSGSGTFTGRSGLTYEGNEDEEYVLSGSGTTFIFRPEETDYRDSRRATPVSKGYDERLTVHLTDPEDHRLIVEDCDSIQY